jgi:hypothetical protein
MKQPEIPVEPGWLVTRLTLELLISGMFVPAEYHRRP